LGHLLNIDLAQVCGGDLGNARGQSSILTGKEVQDGKSVLRGEVRKDGVWV
jgi:hypothetical protein